MRWAKDNADWVIPFAMSAIIGVFAWFAGYQNVRANASTVPVLEGRLSNAERAEEMHEAADDKKHAVQDVILEQVRQDVGDVKAALADMQPGLKYLVERERQHRHPEDR